MLHHKSPDKARHYLDLLDAARCNGNWLEVPELVRKVGKHSPQRKCLQITVQAEYQETTRSTALSQIVSRLTAALQEPGTYPEDVFQGRVCLGSLHWTLNEPALALQTIPDDIYETYKDLDRGDRQGSGWSSVCAIKGACLRGDSQEKANKIDEALRTYERILPHIADTLRIAGSIAEYRLWTERLLAQYCILINPIGKITGENGREPSYTNITLVPFRVWADLWQSGSMNPTTSASNQPARNRVTSRRRVWQVYYNTLSAILQLGTAYAAVIQRPSSSANEMSNGNVKSLDNSKLQQSVELRRVEGIYEDILLREVAFPKANEANIEVESWADQVMANWRSISGPRWLDEDLGKGGKEVYTRNVLAILYRAATRTFHSTRILRHLFTVHTALAEFILAGKAFDTYIELVRKSKVRVEKSGESETGLDNDATVLKTAAAGIQMLCHYGRRKQVERAQEVALILEGWLGRIQSLSESVASADDNPTDLRHEHSHSNKYVPGEALAAAHHSLGVCRAHWARLTYETTSRPELQTKAISSFHAALSSTPSRAQSADLQYGLALILAETRDIDAAIDSVKQAISACNADSESLIQEQRVTSDAVLEGQNRRLLFKAWHLLSFLLSARQDFATAIASCDAANELYGDLLEGSSHSQLSERLALSERESIVELKMSQLVLSEILDGPEEAVNACGDLLGVYKRLLTPGGAHQSQAPAITVSLSKDTDSPPGTANGTVRSARQSILERSKEAVSSLPRVGHHTHHIPITGEASPGISRDTNTSSTLDGSMSERKYQPPHHLARQESKKLHKRRSRKSMVSTRGESPHKSSPADGSEESTQVLPLRVANLKKSSLEAPYDGSSLSHDSASVGVAVTHNASSHEQRGQAGSRALPPTTSHSTHHKNQHLSPGHPKTPPSGSSENPPIAFHLTYSLPDPLYASVDLNRHSVTLLARIWLLIAQLYRGASMPVDAQGALAEAIRQAQSIEATVAAIESSAEALSTPGWGNLKSVAEVWADVHAEQGALHLQLGNSKAASEEFEKALSWFPDHNAATVGLSNMLLDYYDNDNPAINPAASPTGLPKPEPMLASLPTNKSSGYEAGPPNMPKSEASSKLLSRLAARDRAYGLLSMLTKSGRGWDDSEAWSALAKVYEQSGQIDKAKEALWWVVELEDSRPLREWSCIGGF